LPRATLVESASTADAARAALSDSHGAAIASELAGRLYGLAVLREKVQDTPDNMTRFLVIGPPGASDQAAPPAGTNSDDFKTTVLLAVSDRPGALLHLLQPLSEAGVNLTRLESRPSRRRAWDYVFFVELDGHAADPAIARVLGVLAESCPLFVVLGSYRKADAR
jgi:chorismate mutase/prephenate dehydratase